MNKIIDIRAVGRERKVIPFNPMPDGTCRTIKSQYPKNSLANFLREGGWPTMQVLVVEVYDDD